MKKKVYALMGGDMECPEFYKVCETDIEIESYNIDLIISKWCKINEIDMNAKWYNDKFDVIRRTEYKGKISYTLYGREIIIEDVE